MRSKTLFVRSSPSPPDGFVYFLGESLGQRIIVARIREAGRIAIAHNERFSPGTPDIEWIGALARSDVIVLTKDGRIRRRPLERLALRAAAVHAFFLGNRQLRGSAMADAFVLALPRIERIVTASESPVWGSVHADGRVTRVNIDGP